MSGRLDNRFDGKGALVTGGASGIGAATARQMSDEGATLVIVDRDESGKAVADALGNATFIQCDVADADAVASMVAEANEWLVASDVRLDVLFNNAGIGSFAKTPDLTIEAWQKVIDVDLNSIFYACRVAIPIMQENGGGAIVNTGSVSGLFGDYGFSAYNAAKGAVVNYTRTLALDHGPENIRVNALCPGLILTGLTGMIEASKDLMDHWSSLVPLGRPGSAEEMAKVVAFLASDDASYITGAAITADGGITARTGQPNLPAFLG